jgi:hypothetical protein
MSGICPHCNSSSVFLMVSTPYSESDTDAIGTVIGFKFWAVMQCQGCLNLILGGVKRATPHGQHMAGEYQYLRHYPIGKPNDNVAPEIPENIANDFKEALRCRFVDAYNATVEMCRRAVQANCFDLGAPKDKLVKQIDWLAAKGTITTPLKEMAHRIRLGGNLGAHPPEDPNDASEITINNLYADAVLVFTHNFFQHVYVLPERLNQFTFQKPPPTPASGP